MSTIEYKYSNRYSIYFTPLDNGKSEYNVEIHDFDDLSCFTDRVDYIELSHILKGDHYSIV